MCTCVYLYIPVCVTPAYLHTGTLEGKEKAEEITAWKQNQIKWRLAFVLLVSGVSRYLTINGPNMMIFCWPKMRKEEREGRVRKEEQQVSNSRWLKAFSLQSHHCPHTYSLWTSSLCSSHRCSLVSCSIYTLLQSHISINQAHWQYVMMFFSDDVILALLSTESCLLPTVEEKLLYCNSKFNLRQLYIQRFIWFQPFSFGSSR